MSSGPGANGPYTFKWPSNTDAHYASKHNPLISFTGTGGDLSRMVSDNQLGPDLLTGQLPNYSLVSPINAMTCTAPAAARTPTG